jgi:hypothetical protein
LLVKMKLVLTKYVVIRKETPLTKFNPQQQAARNGQLFLYKKTTAVKRWFIIMMVT